MNEYYAYGCKIISNIALMNVNTLKGEFHNVIFVEFIKDDHFSGDVFQINKNGGKIYISLWGFGYYKIDTENRKIMGYFKDESLFMTFLFSYAIPCVICNSAVVLHSSVIKTLNDNAVAFVGDKGAGKTTLSYALCQKKGYTLLADDGIAVYNSMGNFFGYCGNNSVKVWERTANLLNISKQETQKLNDFTEKNIVSVDIEYRPIRIKSIFILNRSADSNISIENIDGISKAVFLRRYLVGTYWIGDCVKSPSIFNRFMNDFRNSIDMYILHYPDFDCATTDQVLSEVKNIVDSTLI